MTAFCYRFVTISLYCTKIYSFSFAKQAKFYAIRRACPILSRCHPHNKVHILILKSGRWCGGFAREQPYRALFCRFFDRNAVGQAYIFSRFLQYFSAAFHIVAEFTIFMPYSHRILQLDGARISYIKLMQNTADLMYFATNLVI